MVNAPVVDITNPNANLNGSIVFYFLWRGYELGQEILDLHNKGAVAIVLGSTYCTSLSSFIQAFTRSRILLLPGSESSTIVIRVSSSFVWLKVEVPRFKGIFFVHFCERISD